MLLTTIIPKPSLVIDITMVMNHLNPLVNLILTTIIGMTLVQYDAEIPNHPLFHYNSDPSRRVVAVNFYPPSSDVMEIHGTQEQMESL